MGVDELEKKLRESSRLLKTWTYGMDPDFLDKNKKLVQDTDKIIKKIMKKNGTDGRKGNERTVRNLKNLIYNNMNRDAVKEIEDIISKQLSTSNGTRFISPEDQLPVENQIIELYGGYMRNTHLLAVEYRNVAKLIPEVQECAGLITDVIINKNSFTGEYITNIIKPTKDHESDDFMKSNNDKIRKRIIDKYDLEAKIESYIHTSLIESSKPVVIYSFKEIMETIQNALNDPKQGSNQNYNDGKYDMTEKQRKQKLSSENINSILDNHDDYRIFNNSPTHKFKTMGLEDDTSSDVSIESIIGDDLMNKFYAASIEDMKTVVENNYQTAVAKLRVEDETGVDFSSLKKQKEDIMGRIDSADKDKMYSMLKEEIYDLVKTIDNNLTIYKGDYAGVNLAKSQIGKYFSMSDVIDTDKSSFYGRNAKTNVKIKEHEYSSDPQFSRNGDKISNYPKHERRDPNGYDAKQDVEFWKNEALIIPLDTENVIPVIINGTHVGYYIFEESAYTGSSESSRKRHSSFTELFKQLGFSNDDALTNYSSYGGFNNLGGADQLNLMAGNGISTGTWSYNMINGNYGDMFNAQNLASATDPLQRIDVMKQIVLKTISKKMQGIDMVNDKRFKDSIMNLLRDGLIVNKKVIVSYVPESQVCYFTPKLDSDGIPCSLLRDALWLCYLYISSILGSAMIKLMKSGTRDKIKFEIGKMKGIQNSIRALEKSLTSRHLNTESVYTSLPRVLKAASTTDTVYEPLVDGKALYEYEDITRVNDISPDDSYTGDLLNRIIRSMGAPTTVVNVLNEEEFATTALSKNISFEKRVNSYKTAFNRTVTKMLRLLINIEGVNKDPEKDVEIFDIDEIEFRFTKSQDLNITNVDSSLKDAISHVDTLTQLYYGDNASSNIDNKSKELFRIETIKTLVPNFDYDQYFDLKNKCDAIAAKETSETKIMNKISETIDNEDIKLGDDDNDQYSY